RPVPRPPTLPGTGAADPFHPSHQGVCGRHGTEDLGVTPGGLSGSSGGTEAQRAARPDDHSEGGSFRPRQSRRSRGLRYNPVIGAARALSDQEKSMLLARYSTDYVASATECDVRRNKATQLCLPPKSPDGPAEISASAKRTVARQR